MNILDNMMRRWLVTLTLLAVAVAAAHAQESDLTISVGGAYEQSIFENRITFPESVVAPDPDEFPPLLDRATIRGYAFHATLSYRLLPWLELATRLGRTKSGASFASRRVEGQVILQGQQIPVDNIIETRHTFAMELWRLDLLARTKLPIGDLTCDLGATAGSRMFDFVKTTSVLVEPRNARFLRGDSTEDSGRVLVLAYNNWPESNHLLLGLTAGFSYPISIFDRLSVVPELTFRYEIIPPDANEAWPVLFASGGISLSYAFGENAPMMGHTPPPPEASSLTAELDLYSIDAAGRRLPHVKVSRGNLGFVRQVFPATTLYFDHGSAAIPVRHTAKAGGIESYMKPSEIAQLPPDEGYYHLLDLIGHRMTTEPRGKLLLRVGRTTDEPATIARQRGESVRRFMAERWKIDPTMIEIIDEGNAPTVKLEMEGARREDIAAAWSEHYFETTPIKVDPSVTSGVGVKSWRITFMQGGKILARQGSDSSTGDLNLAMLLGDMKDGEIPEPIVATLEAEDERGSHVSVTSTLPFERDDLSITGDSIMMMHDLFERAALAESEELGVIAHHIAERYKTGMQVTISPLSVEGPDASRLEAIAARLRKELGGAILVRVVPHGAFIPSERRFSEDVIFNGAVRITVSGRTF